MYRLISDNPFNIVFADWGPAKDIAAKAGVTVSSLYYAERERRTITIGGNGSGGGKFRVEKLTPATDEGMWKAREIVHDAATRLRRRQRARQKSRTAKRKAYSREYYAAHREYFRAYQREWYQKHKYELAQKRYEKKEGEKAI